MTKILKTIIAGIAFTSAAVVFVPSTANGQVKEILSSDFEKGTQKWEARGAGGVSIRSTDKDAAGGQKSLQVRGRKEFWQGAQLNLTNFLKAGVTYRFKVKTKLEAGSEPAVLKMTLQRGDQAFYSLSAAPASDKEWITLSGSYRPDGKDPYLLVYVESEDPRVSYFLDDFSIESVEIDQDQKGLVLKTDFQDGTQQNWLVFGDGLQVFSGQIGDNVVLKVDGRKSSADGLALDITPYIFPGKRYRISVSTFLGGGPAKDTVKIVVRRTDSDGKVSYTDVGGSDSVSGTSWTKISGEYEAPGDGSYLVIVQAKGDKTAYFVDDFELEAL
jgi:hypothetical protein